MAARTPAWAQALIARMDALEEALVAPVAPVAQARATVALVDTCTCGAEFKYGRKPADLAGAGDLHLCGLKGRTTHRQ